MSEDLTYDPVGVYEEVPTEQRSAEETAAVEDRTEPDQIVDYHQTNPTLVPGPAHEYVHVSDEPTDVAPPPVDTPVKKKDKDES